MDCEPQEVDMIRCFAASLMAIIAVAGSTACATKKYVQTSVSDVAGRVDSLGNALEQTQEETRKNDARIQEVNTTVQSVRQTAQQAGQAAQDAASLAKTVAARTEAIEKTSTKLAYEVVLSGEDVTFAFGQADLSDSAKSALNALVEKLKQDPRNVLIAIEGHTDSTGPRAINERIGLERAEAVERYLYEQYQIPLPKMDVISYGEEKPIAPNTTRAGRAQNRRVVIKVMA
jgi:outer membrane protein OmpA-like peptidoglycan-associated protein